MKSKSKSSRVFDRYGMIEALEPRIAPAAATVQLPANPTFVTVTAGGSLLVKAGEVLATGSAGGGSYLLYVAQGQVLVHTTDLNLSGQLDFNEITGLSVGAGAIVVSFVDIHGPVITDLNPDGTLSDGGKGDILLDNNIAEIQLRSLNTGDFAGTSVQTPAELVAAHLALSNYSIFGNIYAGGGLGLANNVNSGLLIDTSGEALQQAKYTGNNGTDFYQAVEPIIGSIYVGSSASGKSFSFGSTGSATDVFGNLLTFNPAPQEAGASIYNIGTASPGEAFSIGTIHAGDGGFNAAGGNIVNVALFGDNAGTYQVIAGNAGNGTTGLSGGSILNFSEGGAFISEVVLQSGNGGTGLTGAGGNAGAITFNPAAPIEVNAHFILNYGAGGDGYTAGGAGGGTPSGTFVTPVGQLTTAINLVTTTHAIGTIGSTQSIDFNNDGFSDAVFSTTNPNQIVVALGNYTAPVTASSTTTLSAAAAQTGFGLDSNNYIFLNSPAQVDSIVVGDFTGNGHLDIAAASGNGTYAGVEVYLSEYNPKTGAFEGFSDPLFSPLPSLTANFDFFTSTAITKLVAGDFIGNGAVGLAALVTETNLIKGVDEVLIFLNPEINATHPYGSGYFYANFANGNDPIVDFGGNFSPNSIFEVTALKTFVPTKYGATVSNGNDVIIEANLGTNFFNVIDDGSGNPLDDGGGAPLLTTYSFGKVDNNRKLPAGSNQNIDLENFEVLGLTVTQDTNARNFADVVALSKTPVGFLEIFTGSESLFGGFNFTLQTGNSVSQAGVYFGNVTADPVAIVTVPNVTDTFNSDVAILDYTTPGLDYIYVLNITESLTPLTMVATPTEAAGVMATAGRSAGEVWYTLSPVGRDVNTVAFDTYNPHPALSVNIPNSGPGEISFITADPITAYPSYQGVGVSQPDTVLTLGGGTGGTILVGGVGLNAYPFKTAGYYFNAGNGGSSESGAGGAGGSFGETLTVTGSGTAITATGTVSVEYPTNFDYEGTIVFTGGNGGNGFNNGGAGGALVGISVNYPVTLLTGAAYLYAGNGGESLTGTGGNGGSLSQLYIQTGTFFQTGSGGIGVIGGNGGNLLGNTEAGLVTSTSNLNDDITLVTGSGATGINGGGTGGNINSFVNDFLPLEAGLGGFLYYTAGAGGDAVAGQAGTGGSILNSSPSILDNNLVGDIFLQAGNGGNGLYGGSGGNVANFVQISTIKDNPTSFTIFSGYGGNATLGVGGAGGNISGISIAASGIGTNLFAVNYNRMVAGSGGSSAGGTGGAGGSVTGINSTSIDADSQNVVAAGAGGDGLSAGGAGGSVDNAIVDAGATSGKVLIIAGAGGNSDSVKPVLITGKNLTNQQIYDNDSAINYAIGGVDGPGGAGGSIENFTQPVNVNTHVDLIAGNGGSTINHSVAAGNATVDNSGVGGSILNASIAGSIGNSDATVAIKSYNDVFTGQTIQEFVNTNIVDDITGTLTDTNGNVGLVAGAAGRVEYGGPSMNGISGSVDNVHAENIMSMVAGSVVQVDLIQSLTNYGVTINGGILGANKTVFFNTVTEQDDTIVQGTTPLALGNLNYISIDGALVMTPLPGGGQLIDGAFLAKNIRQIESPRDFQGTQPSS